MNAQNCSPDELAVSVRGVLNNTPGSGENLFYALERGIRFYLLRILRYGPVADDGVHDCFMTVLQAIQSGTLREPAAVAGFTVTVTRRYGPKIIDT